MAVHVCNEVLHVIVVKSKLITNFATHIETYAKLRLTHSLYNLCFFVRAAGFASCSSSPKGESLYCKIYFMCFATNSKSRYYKGG